MKTHSLSALALVFALGLSQVSFAQGNTGGKLNGIYRASVSCRDSHGFFHDRFTYNPAGTEYFRLVANAQWLAVERYSGGHPAVDQSGVYRFDETGAFTPGEFDDYESALGIQLGETDCTFPGDIGPCVQKAAYMGDSRFVSIGVSKVIFDLITPNTLQFSEDEPRELQSMSCIFERVTDPAELKRLAN